VTREVRLGKLMLALAVNDRNAISTGEPLLPPGPAPAATAEAGHAHPAGPGL
jgi:hypothetical protein